MKKLIGYGVGLAVVKNSVPQETIDELWDAISMKDMTKGITSGMDRITKEIEGMSRISFNVGSGKISLNDFINYFSAKVSNLWGLGEAAKVITGMIFLIIGAVSFLVMPIVTVINYFIKGIKDKANYNLKLRTTLMILGMEASVGLTLILFFVRILNI